MSREGSSNREDAMTETMTELVPTISDQQFDQIVNSFRDALRKQRDTMSFDSINSINIRMGADNLGEHLLAALQFFVETHYVALIVRHTNVNSTRFGREALQATGRNVYGPDDIIREMRHDKYGAVYVIFFKPKASEYEPNGMISNDGVDKAFESRGLKPVDPYSLIAVNEADPAFADLCPNITHCKDRKGNWFSVEFGRFMGQRSVIVQRSDNASWDLSYWLAGVPVST